ncbi:hypothetical protein CR513_41411, partial [Mucuna pruriens]
MTKNKVITLEPNELPNLVSSSRLDDYNYLQWIQYIRTTLKGHKKLSHVEENDPLRDDPKFEELTTGRTIGVAKEQVITFSYFATIESLPMDVQVQVQVQEVTESTLVPKQVQLSESESFIVVIDAIKTPTSVKGALKDEN